MTSNRNSNNSGGNGFQSLGLSDFVFRGILRIGFRNPTPVQRKSLPIILTGSDTVVMARTGSGKTAAFLIPLIQKLQEVETTTNNPNKKCRGLILSPTRELSLQTLKVMNKLAHFTDIKSIGIHGGEGMEKQFDFLASKPDVIVATPGRLAHHLSEIPDFDLKCCQMCILDEADRLLEMGFTMQIREISSTLPEYCQKVLLSATMPRQLIEFTKSGFTRDPHVVRMESEANVSPDLRMSFITCRSTDKDAALLHVLDHIQRDKEVNQSNRTGLTLIFVATRHHVDYVSNLLQANQIETSIIYGSLDQEARKANLSAFRSGKKPILVVTDVAARGIDVPLIDHVVHYAFPSSVKLFIHRSGRAARAGRLGYCWSLVEPEEMPYMVDLHLHLGRKLSTELEEVYTLDEMTPAHVHYGSVPESILTREVENVRRIMNSELTGSNQAETLRALTTVCNNAMKQYRRSRPEASRQGSRRAKAILEGEKTETGQRFGGGTIPSHPLLRGMERETILKLKKSEGVDPDAFIKNSKKREDFLRCISNFRPKETIFETVSAGGGKNTGIVSHVDKGRTTKKDNSTAFNAMRDMRRQMRIAHDNGASLVVAGTQNLNNDVDDEPEEQNQKPERFIFEGKPQPHVNKVRLSKAARKRLKKQGSSMALKVGEANLEEETKTKNKRGTDFRDESFFIDNDFTSNTDEANRARQIDASMQPSAANNLKGTMGAALILEKAMVDVMGDEHADLAQKQRMMRWDKSKRKYVQTTVGAELHGGSKSKKLRLESGAFIKNNKLKLGEQYEKWQKKTNRSIGRVGIFDDVDTSAVSHSPSLTINKDSNHKEDGDKRDKPKNAQQLHKERKKKEQNKLKNMKKEDRRKLTYGKDSREKNGKKPGKNGKKGGNNNKQFSRKR